MNKKFNAIYLSLTTLVLFCLMIYIVVPHSIFAERKSANANQQTVQMQNDDQKLDESLGNIPVYFEENNGQFDKRVKYFARGTNGYSLFLTGTEAVYSLRSSPKSEVQSPKSEDNLDVILDSELRTQDSTKAVAVYMKLAGANENSSSVGLEELPHKTNYFKGNDESKWQTNVPNFRQIRMNNVYQGIDTVWHGKENGGVQYDFVVYPNANPNQIEWEIEGAESVEIDEKGDLLIRTEFGEIRQQKPFTYQEISNGLKQEVESSFIIKEQLKIQNSKFNIAFRVGNYDRSKTLTIDPSVNLGRLATSTLLGGEASDTGNAIKVDKAGNIYVTGRTQSMAFPTSPGTFDTSSNGSVDVFVTKLNTSGSELIFSTFLGGSNADEGYELAVDASENVYVTGRTFDAPVNFPTTAGAFDETQNGDRDAFVTKLNSTGSALIYSTFLGGSLNDRAFGIAIDTAGNAYVSGETTDAAIDFPTTSGAFDTTHNGGLDAFATKLNPAGSAIIYSTFLGGSGDDTSNGIAIDGSGNAYLTGLTNDDTSDYPTTAGAFDENHNGLRDVFVTKLNATGSAIAYSTFLGGNHNEIGSGIAVDAFGNAFVTGETFNGTIDFPTTNFSFDTTHNGSNDVFVTKLASDGSALTYSTFLGGGSDDRGYGITLDSTGNAYVTGFTTDNNISFPVTGNAFITSHQGAFDAFVTKVDPTGSTLVYSTFLGGSGFDTGYGIAVDSSGNAFITGDVNNSSTNFPTTPEAFQRNINGFRDAFITKLGDISISGRTVDNSGNPLPNSAIAMSGNRSGFMLSDGQGYFGFSDTVQGGNFTIAANNLLYNFTPNTFQINDISRNEELIFLGSPKTSGPTAAFAALGGTVESTVGNVGLPNTRLTLIDTVNGDVNVVTTDANGDYQFESVVTGAFYLVIAEREGYNFAPQVFEINHFDENLNLDFRASPNAPRPVDDFDGDGKTDLAVFRPSEGNWYILQSQDNSVRIVQFGVDGDIPVASDYDGDNRSDLAVYRPTDGNWYRLNSSNGQFSSVHFGISEDTPIPADFDGDGKTDLAVYRPSTGVWHRLLSENGNYQADRFGISTDTPIAADYDNDNKADLSVYRDGIWYRLRSSDGQVQAFQFGVTEDKPLAVDFDGDGRMDTAVYRPSNGTWHWLESSDGDYQAKQFGVTNDVPTPADYNGDGRYEQSVFRDGTWFVLRNDNSFYSAQFGQMGDVPIPGK